MKKSKKKRRDKSEVDGSQARTTKTLSTEAYSKKTVDQAVVPMNDKTITATDVGDNEEGASRRSDTFTASETGPPVFERETHTSDSQPGAFPTSTSGVRSMVSSGTINIGSEMSFTDRALLRPHTNNNRAPSDRSSSTLTTETHIIATVVPIQGPPSTIYENEGVPEPKPLGETIKDRHIKILIASLIVVILALVGTIVAIVVTSGKGDVSGSTRVPMDSNVASPPTLATSGTTRMPTDFNVESPPTFATSASTRMPVDGNEGSPLTLATSSPLSSTEGAITPTTNVTSEPSTSPLTRTMPPTSRLQDIFDFLNASSFDQGLALQSTLSPQYQSFEWLLAESKFEEYSRERLLQRYALNTFYYIIQNIGAYQWKYLNQSDHECQWPLVYCNANEFIDSLEMNDQGFKVLVPGEFGFLTDMTSLSLARNGVSGSLPSSLEKWTRLESFQASDNLLTGTFPEFFSRLSRLTNLDLSTNQFTGKLPSSLSGMSSLQKISIATNAFSGPIPSDLWTLTALQYVTASNNTLSGTISAGMANAPALLGVILELNNFTGKIPKGLGTLGNTNNLLSLDLFENALTGEIPSSLGGLIKLSTLDLGNNKFTGSIPSQLGLLIYLDELLDLSGNKLVGTIPTELGRLRKLSQLFDLGRNQLNGTIPSELGFLTNLELLFSLAHNNLSGSIPTTLGGLTVLSNLYLEENKNMTGTIPFQLGQMVTLNAFLAYNNRLNGTVPESLCNLTVTGYLTRVEVNCDIECTCCTSFCF